LPEVPLHDAVPRGEGGRMTINIKQIGGFKVTADLDVCGFKQRVVWLCCSENEKTLREFWAANKQFGEVVSVEETKSLVLIGE
jgi:hypothetical protein